MELFQPDFWTGIVGDFLFGVFITKGSMLAALIVGLGFVLRRASAAVRSTLWTVGVGALLLLPLIVGWMPVWQVAVAEFPSDLFRTTTTGAAADGSGIARIGWLALLWTAGALLFLGRFGVHLLRIARTTGRAEPVRGRLAELVEAVSKDLGLQGVRVALSDAEGVPLAWGVRRPVVLLPREARAWPEGMQRAVLRHELAHIERRDYLALVAMEICRALHWPNPLVWYLLRRARMDQELACDDAAIRSGILAAEYARHLVAVARSFASVSPAPAAALPVLGVSPLATRVEAALERGASRKPLTRLTATLALALIAAATVPVAAANVWSCPDSPAAAVTAEDAGRDGLAPGSAAPAL